MISTGQSLPANLSFTSYTQVNFVVPPGLANGSATATISNAAGFSASYPIMITTLAPAIFTANSTGSGVAAADVLAVAADGSTTLSSVFSCLFSCSPLPVQLSPTVATYLILYGTGIRGVVGTSGVSVMLGSQSGTVTFAGAQASFPGLDQLNVLVPNSLAGSGTVPVSVMVNGVAANSVSVAFK